MCLMHPDFHVHHCNNDFYSLITVIFPYTLPSPFLWFDFKFNMSHQNLLAKCAKLPRRCKIFTELMVAKCKWKDVKVWLIQIRFVNENEHCFLEGTYGCLKQQAAAKMYLEPSPYSLETDSIWHTQQSAFSCLFQHCWSLMPAVIIENNIWMERTINTFLALLRNTANIQEACFQFIFGIISVGLFLIMAN